MQLQPCVPRQISKPHVDAGSANQVGAANDAWEKVQEAANGVFRQIAAEAAPTQQALAEIILEIVRATKGW